MSSLLNTSELLPQISAPSLITSKGHIRPLVDDDVAQIRDLWRRATGRTIPSSESLMKRLFFEVPWHDDSLSSLAYEDHQGRVVACLGIMPRPMKFHGNPIRAAVGHHFIVDASRQGTRAGVELARRFIQGPQDLAVAAGNDFSRRIWKSLGGCVSSLHSFSWTRALRPAQYALSSLRDRGVLPSAAVTLSPACRALDAMLTLFSGSQFRPNPPVALSDHLDSVTMFAGLSAFAGDCALQPVYDVSTLAWLVETLGETAHRGNLHKVAVRTHSGRLLGWYLYHLRASGAAEVLQVGAKEDAVHEVLEHLFYHAQQRGAIAATGPLDARLLGVLSECGCVFHRPANAWTLIHSRDTRIADAIRAGDAFLSNLEGARWVETETEEWL